MKKLISILALLTVTISMTAVPAKKGLWKTIKLADGTEIRVQLRGDEFGHHWQSADGQAYMKAEDGTYALLTKESVQAATQKRAQAQQRREMRLPMFRNQRNGLHRAAANSAYTGQKKGLILLVEFQDTKFQEGNDQAFYNNIANKAGYTDSNGFVGSIYDYFKDQSRGQFELTFDVVGPVTVSKKASYYGENDKNGSDKYPEEMVQEAVTLAKQLVTDWKQYDWDDDGEVDQVMIVYAGEGEADGGSEDTIWPHEYTLYYSNKTVKVATGLKVNTYAVANEGYMGQESYYSPEKFMVNGIGIICHEFSHCLGLADMYDINYEGHFGMGDWSIMDSGSSLDNGFCPSGYTSFEKYQIGWLTPIELNKATSITNMKPLNSSDEVYIIQNAALEDEFYLIENHQQTGWDKYTPAKGMLILHVDYDEDIWMYNLVNSINDGSDGYPKNDHQRCTIFHADGTDKTGYTYNKINEVYEEILDATGSKYDQLVEEYYELWDQYDADVIGDVYPQSKNNQLTNTSTPRAFLYNKNSDGRKLMNVSITDITQNADGTMSFNFALDNSGSGTEGDNTDYGNGQGQGGEDTPERPSVEGALFYESFDNCDGTGGNDDLWKGTIATAEFSPDNDGWVTVKAYGGNECAKFGTGSVNGSATTPAFTMDGSATLYFRAGAWNGSRDATTLNLSVSNGTITPETITMKKGEFSDFTATINATGNVKITLESILGRFFLDEVLVKDPNAAGIQTITLPTDQSGRIYSIDGRYVGTDLQLLKPGLYIINGKKIAIK